MTLPIQIAKLKPVPNVVIFANLLVAKVTHYTVITLLLISTAAPYFINTLTTFA